jgi:hypothetical protein
VFTLTRDTNKTDLITLGGPPLSSTWTNIVAPMAAIGLSNRNCCCAQGGVCVQRVWARKMSTFGNNLIEPLRTRSVDVQPQNQLGERSIAPAKNLSIGETRKRGERKSRLYVFFARAQWHGRQPPSFRPLPQNLKAMCGIALAAYWQLGKPMFKEVMKEVCHEGTYGFYRKPN